MSRRRMWTVSKKEKMVVYSLAASLVYFRWLRHRCISRMSWSVVNIERSGAVDEGILPTHKLEQYVTID